MKNTLRIICLTISLLALYFTANSQTHAYISDKINCTYETYKGRIHGKYISYYPNGNKKAEGNFENNYRSGNWKVWDSSGVLKVERFYRNPFEYDILLPGESEDNRVTLPIPSVYTLQYNSDNYIESFVLDASMVTWGKRIWRWIPIENNDLLFENNILFNTIHHNVIQGNMIAYNSSNDIFTKELKFADIDTSNLKIIGFKIKEDHSYDTRRSVSEARILGICPVAIHKTSMDTIDIYWVRFPALRKYLAAVNITNKSNSATIKTLDDLFFFRDFYGIIYKEDNIYNRSISDYKKGEEINKEAESIEINLIEMEHELWSNL